MVDNEPRRTAPTSLRDAAQRLREIAVTLRYDLTRRAQLHALAAAFDRYADRVEREMAD
jgi:hypothetical protein